MTEGSLRASYFRHSVVIWISAFVISPQFLILQGVTVQHSRFVPSSGWGVLAVQGDFVSSPLTTAL